MTEKMRAFLLREGLDDWVSYEQLRGECPEASDDELLEAVRAMAADGLIEVGDLRQGSFRAWDGGIDGWIDRIRAITRDEPNWHLTIWLSNTPAGDALARRS